MPLQNTCFVTVHRCNAISGVTADAGAGSMFLDWHLNRMRDTPCNTDKCVQRDSRSMDDDVAGASASLTTSHVVVSAILPFNCLPRDFRLVAAGNRKEKI
jgi:hypothetical protein